MADIRTCVLMRCGSATEPAAVRTLFVAGCRSRVGDTTTSAVVCREPTGVDCGHTRSHRGQTGVAEVTTGSQGSDGGRRGQTGSDGDQLLS